MIYPAHIKRAVKRDPAAPVGVCARLFIECCGARVWLDQDDSAIFGHREYVRCPVCLTTYDQVGWIIPPVEAKP